MEASLGDKDPWEKHYEDVVKSQKAWWWMAHISISVIALLGNLVFLITIIYNRWVNAVPSKGHAQVSHWPRLPTYHSEELLTSYTELSCEDTTSVPPIFSVSYAGGGAKSQ